MTGEVTLQGRVLPIGGLKQKVLAAHAAGLTEVILPERNRGDLDEVPEEVREQMTFHPGDEHRRGARARRWSRPSAEQMSPRCRSCAPVPSELRAVAELLERRWTLGTIYACSSGAARFNEFRQSLPGISPTTLSDRLEQLEAAGIVERRLVPGRPPHAEYRLTATGERLAAAVSGLLRQPA